MMGSESMQTLPGLVFQSKMPLFDGTLSSAGLPKPPSVSAFLGKPALQYDGAYVAYDPRATDRALFAPPPWSGSKASLLEGRSPLSHISGRVGPNHLIYRRDGTSSEEGHSHAGPVRPTPPKPGFTLYAKSPETSSPVAAVPVAIRKPKSQCENSSSHAENSVYLAVPKPVYRHSRCCSEPGCMMRPAYGGDPVSPRLPSAAYERDWRQSDGRYAELSPLQRKAPGTDPLKRLAAETFSPGGARPAVVEPSYSSYPSAPARRLLGSLSEHGQALQPPPRGYPGLFPSHPTYEHMTSEVYQERSPMSKYGQLAQHPLFYYPQANVEVEHRMQCKDSSGKKKRDDVLVLHKHAISNPQEHYVVPRSLHAEMPLPLPHAEMLPAPSFLQSFEYPCYAVPRFHLEASQIRSPLKRQRVSPDFHAGSAGASPSSQHAAAASSSHRGHPDASVLIDLLKTSPPFFAFDQASPARQLSQPAVSPPSVQLGRFFSPLAGLHLDPAALSPQLPPPPLPPPPDSSADKPLDYSSGKARGTCLKRPQSPPAPPPAAPKSHSPNHKSARIRAAAAENPEVRTTNYSPGPTAMRHGGCGVITEVTGQKDRLKRSISQMSQPVKLKEEDEDLYEVNLTKKRPKVALVQLGNSTDSPPLPVIDTVFSLAPYQVYLQATRVLYPSRVLLQTPALSPEQQVARPHPDNGKETPAPGDRQHVAGTPAQPIHRDAHKTATRVAEAKNVKVEKADSSETGQPAETRVGQSDRSQVAVKKEPEDGASFDTESRLPSNTCESDDRDMKPTLSKTEAPNEAKPIVLKTLVGSPCGGDTQPPHREVVPHPASPVQPPETNLRFKNISPECLKLSSYKIVLPDGRFSSAFQPLERPPPAQPPAALEPKQEPQVPARKHFLELHHSLCKLVSKSVSASSEQDLKNWLSQLDVIEPASPSAKVQKVSCLLGTKAREQWINEEMRSALQEVLQRLGEYTAQERCPFPHVMRTGAVFLPMLVVKELLFPMVQGGFIDQVLQEHKVGLRPTTLSEEKILIQLHKRACSSKLRRLMSLKTLPDIYADVVNILYYTYVRKHLGLDVEPDHREQGGRCEASGDWLAAVFSDNDAAAASRPQTPGDTQGEEAQPKWIRKKTKSRVKTSSRRMFLDDSLSEEEEAAGDAERVVVGGDEFPGVQESQDAEHIVAKRESPVTVQSPAPEDSWTCPLSFSDVSSMERESEDTSSSWPVLQSSGSAQPQARSKNHPGMVLKLRRTLSGGLDRKKACYQAVLESGASAAPSSPRSDDGDAAPGERRATQRWQRTAVFSHALRPLSSSSQRKRRSLLKIKYCPYLSACHSAEHRRRWVLRSAVQRARKAMRFYYPDLVGKTIHHLYEEDDKSEVWYRGEVLRIHEAHTNPLKTIFEVTYDSEPEWKYYLELLMDYKKGWLKIED